MISINRSRLLYIGHMMEWRRRKARKITGKTSGIVPTGKETCGEHVYLRFSPRILCVPYGSDSNSSPKLKIRP